MCSAHRRFEISIAHPVREGTMSTAIITILWGLSLDGWIPSVDLLGSVPRLPYLVSLYMEKDKEKLKPTEIALKPLQTS